MPNMKVRQVRGSSLYCFFCVFVFLCFASLVTPFHDSAGDALVEGELSPRTILGSICQGRARTPFEEPPHQRHKLVPIQASVAVGVGVRHEGSDAPAAHTQLLITLRHLPSGAQCESLHLTAMPCDAHTRRCLLRGQPAAVVYIKLVEDCVALALQRLGSGWDGGPRPGLA